MRGLAPYPDCKENVAAAWQKYRDRQFVKRYDELYPAEQFAIDERPSEHYCSISIAYKPKSPSSPARICLDGTASYGPNPSSLNENLPVGILDINLPRAYAAFITYPAIGLADLQSYYQKHFLDV